MSAHNVTVSITPLCTSCGAELRVGMTESKPTGNPLTRDNPSARTAQRVFVYACADCFVHKADLPASETQP